ncbi:MAG: hypothetical protein NUV83_01010 [Candidatus Wolfebacteria bacterium]|nr:hypothetical protein [Candidatus Wolfebacteria bacterium]
MEKKFFILRHSDKPDEKNPESQTHPGLSEKGVEKAKEQKAREIKEIIDNAPDRALIYIGGATELARTKSTAIAAGEGLKTLYENDETVLVLIKEEILNQAGKTGSISSAIKKIIEIVESDENKNKKIVVDFPLFVKELSFDRRWDAKKDNFEYYDYLDKKYGDNEEGAFEEWSHTKGENIEGSEGPNPETVAEEYLFGLDRLHEFAKKYFPERPVVIGAVSHRWDLDAAILKLITGEVSPKSFKEISDEKLTDTTEGATITIGGDQIKIVWRGKEFEVKIEEQNE